MLALHDSFYSECLQFTDKVQQTVGVLVFALSRFTKTPTCVTELAACGG